MDFSTPDDLAEHRDAAKTWVRDNVRSEWAEEQYRTGTHETLELHALLARSGVLGAGWDKEYGGSDTDPGLAKAIIDEIRGLGIAGDGWATTNMVIRTIHHVGTEEQKRTLIPAALRGEILIALGYSEPDSGTDVAAAKTAAFRDGDEWVINGQKMFTSSAQVCTHVFVLARTNPSVPKHRGLTMFLVPTDAAGFERQPIYTLGGQQTNATFYTDIRVPDSARIGDVDEGWGVMRVALVFERGGAARGSSTHTLSEAVAQWARGTRGEDGSVLFEDPSTKERLGRIAVDEEVARLLGLRVRWMSECGELPGVEGSMAKLFNSESALRHYSDVVDFLGDSGTLQPGAIDAPMGGKIEAGLRAAQVGTIYGGSSEIQREIIAERRLGLPRVRPNG